MAKSGTVSIPELARISGYSVDHLRRLARQGVLPGRRVRGRYVLDRSECLRRLKVDEAQ